MKNTAMAKEVYKHKLLLDEHMHHREHFPQVNVCFDLKHIADDLGKGGAADSAVYNLAVATTRIILTQNARDFEGLVGRQEDWGVISIPPHWRPQMIGTKLLALLRRHGPGFFQGRVVSLDAAGLGRRAA